MGKDQLLCSKTQHRSLPCLIEIAALCRLVGWLRDRRTEILLEEIREPVLICPRLTSLTHIREVRHILASWATALGVLDELVSVENSRGVEPCWVAEDITLGEGAVVTVYFRPAFNIFGTQSELRRSAVGAQLGRNILKKASSRANESGVANHPN